MKCEKVCLFDLYRVRIVNAYLKRAPSQACGKFGRRHFSILSISDGSTLLSYQESIKSILGYTHPGIYSSAQSRGD